MTLFRSLPPSAVDEVRRSLARAASIRAPDAIVAGVMDLDSGVALRIDSAALEQLRSELAGEFRGLLTAQDSGPWTPHVTIQNKAGPRAARTLLRRMREQFEPFALKFAGLDLVLYAGGGWEPVASYRFR